MKITKIENEEDLKTFYEGVINEQQRKIYKYWLENKALKEVFLNKTQIEKLKEYLKEHPQPEHQDIIINVNIDIEKLAEEVQAKNLIDKLCRDIRE